MEGNKGSIAVKILIAVLVILVIAAGALVAVKVIKDKKAEEVAAELAKKEEEEKPQVVEIKEPTTFVGDDRPIAVMLDNHEGAVPQGGLTKAYMVYEIIVEGQYSRLMALFKGVELDQIGPVRSSRHYFLDYALENDAIYVHFGWSPQAQSDIKTLGVNNINGITESSTSFWRVTDKYAPHNVATSTEKIKKIAEAKGYRTTSDQKSVLKYVGNEFDLDSDIIATKISLPYATGNVPHYEYDEETRTYQRFSADGKKVVDWTTGEDVKVKNIIITFCDNWLLNDPENKGRRTIDNVKTLDGYYITNGKAIKIKCEKTSRSTQTVYKDLEGNEIEVNDGNTFVQIVPLNSKVLIEPGEPTPEEEVTTNTIEEQ